MTEVSMIKVGISSCVLGDKVRFDGGHKQSNFVTSNLTKVFSFVPICPEVGMGMTIPRPAIHIVEVGNETRLTDSKDQQIDHTDKLNGFYAQQKPRLEQLDGYILASKSPTCGLFRIKVFGQNGELVHRKGQGMYAAQLQRDYPNLPIEEDGRLNDAGLRESFVTKVYAHNRFRTQVMDEPSLHKLVQYHSQYKFLVMAYSPRAYQQLGRLVATGKALQLDTLLHQYLNILMQCFSKPTNRKKHTNVLMHLQGFFKKHLDKSDKQELSEQIEKYRLGYVPLLAPVTLLQHYLKDFPNEYLAQQVYLNPYPEELRIRA